MIDDVAGGELATTHLLDLGHERIGFVGDLPDGGFGFTSSDDRREGFRRALALRGLVAADALARTGPHDRIAAAELAAELLALTPRPTAIFAASDTQALGVLQAAAAARIPVPRELSVIGFDDIDLASYVGLTTVRQPLFESGRRGAEHLLAELQEPTGGAPEERLPLDLVVRKTTGPPA